MDKFITKKPINKTAALVVGKGYEYTPDKKIQTADQDTPIPTKPILKNQLDLTGYKVGRLTVIGLSDKKHKKYALWVARCDCGVYTERRAKTIRNEANSDDCCELCRHLNKLKRDERRRRTGKY
ncbi:hypothetical protein KAR91_62255 [Candidatus Pacearchaeota archaeon]|nr:hypothetical protein [Candidatus Pacearchaeota archaeon]